MAKHLKQFSISDFRGIKGLHVENTSDINILVGDNNSGKTSVLEALLLLKNPTNFINVIHVARLRESRSFLSPFRVSNFEAFTNLFNKLTDKEYLELQVNGMLGNKFVEMSIKGKIENVMVDLEEVAKSSLIIRRKIKNGEIFDNIETQMFNGEQSSFVKELSDSYNTGENFTENINFSNYTSITGAKKSDPLIVDFVYVSPTDHSLGNVFGKIIRNDRFKAIVIKILQTFDKDIIDLLILPNDQSNAPVEYIKHNNLGNMPLSTYGDGIKKVLLLANSIADAQNGILLMDEIETAIHIKAYKDIFNFVVKACMEFNVQLFATTHSIEAVDSILQTQYNSKTEEYDKARKDLIRVVTFRKDDKTGKTLSRVLSGEEVFHDREAFGFEVRI